MFVYIHGYAYEYAYVCEKESLTIDISFLSSTKIRQEVRVGSISDIEIQHDCDFPPCFLHK